MTRQAVAAVIAAFALFWAGLAYAGEVQIKDAMGVIPTSQADAVRADGPRWPFDLRVMTGDYPSGRALDSAVHSCVDRPNVVCVGIDPVHHSTYVHFGTGTGVRPSDFEAIAASGNSLFKAGDWQGGIEAIADRAVQSRQQAGSVHPSPPPGMDAGWWIFGTLVAIVALVGIWIAWRSRKRQEELAARMNSDMDDFREEASEYRSRNLEERDWHDKMGATMRRRPAVPVPASAPTAQSTVVVNQQSSGNDLLLGYELGRMTSPAPVIKEREVVREVVREDPSTSWSTSDSGGSSSDWSSSNSSSGSSYDSGGSSSSWDSGSSSSFDSGGGGGGFDGGGGGGSW